MSHRKAIARIVYWANHGDDWRRITHAAGYDIDEQMISANTTEYRLSQGGDVVALLARIDGEFYGFVWTPEARHWRDHLRYRLRFKTATA